MTTYKQAGVDVAAAARWVGFVRRLAASTRRKELVQGIGSFGGGMTLPGRSGPRAPVLVASADGVGTKLKIAQLAGRFESLGEDLVAMNVNDILCVGAEPLFFLDYIAAGRLEPQVLAQIVRGVVKGCRVAGCVLLGGETAQMGLLYKKGDFDLAGFAVGVVERRRLLRRKSVRPGDRVLGLPSSGPHANGFSLVQKVLSRAEIQRRSAELLKPTRIYVRPVLKLLRSGLPVRAIAHITGGSFSGKIPRVLPEGTSARLDRSAWKVPAVFRRIEAAGVGREEMVRTFNMGIGMALILPGKAVPAAQRALKRHKLEAPVIGEVIRGKREVLWA